jgi:hypothetical protein
MHVYPRTDLRRIAFVVFASVAVLAAGCATARLASGWSPSPVVVDGRVDDWSDKGACSVMKDGLRLSVGNDAERLYVMAEFRANDPQWSRAAGRGGLILSVTGPRRRTMSFRLPEGPERAPDANWQARSADGRDTIRNPRADLGHIPAPMWAEFAGKLVITDVDKNVVPVEADGSAGPAAGFSEDNGMCVYEFGVPLLDTAVGHYSLRAGAGIRLNLTVTAGPGAEMRRAMQEMRAQGSPEGGRGFGGGEGDLDGRGGFGHGSRPGGPPGGQSAASPSLSLAVQLATRP